MWLHISILLNCQPKLKFRPISIQITTTITTTPTLSPISPLRDDVNCQLDICSICQLYISDPTQGCSFCQHPGFGNISVSLSVSNSPQSPDLELAAEISGSIRAESSFQSQKGDHSSLSIDAHTSPERHLFEQNTFQSPLPSKSRCVSVQSVTIMIRKALKVCPGCGMSRTLEECFNGHQQCRRCLSDGCHECLGKRRRFAKKKWTHCWVKIELIFGLA